MSLRKYLYYEHTLKFVLEEFNFGALYLLNIPLAAKL